MTRRRTTMGAVALGLAITLALTACGSDGPGTPAAAAATAEHGEDHEAPAYGEGGKAAVRDRIDAVDFHQDMRKLWEDHITWTRLFLVSAIAGLPDVDATAGRLLQNQDDIGDAVAVFYGEDAGSALSGLLREHILIAADLVTAAKSGDTAAVTTHSDRWYENADAVARFLADANRAWPYGTLRAMMRGHLDQTLAEATARLQGDWAADIAEYDRIHDHILEMSDALADGIVQQFPERFAS